MKRIPLITLMASAICQPLWAAGIPDHQLDDPWYSDGKAQVLARVERAANPDKAKNVILFVGDGMGVSTLTAGRIFQGQNLPDNEGGEEHVLVFEQFPFSALVKTYNSNQQVPDSAGTATAMLTGVKTKAGLVGIAQNATRGDCESSQGYELTTALELAEDMGLSTGVVTTTTLTHATPAAAYAHVADRDWEVDADMPDGTGCSDIAAQLIDQPFGDGVDVAMGGGREFFLPEGVSDNEGGEGERLDGRNLVDEWSGEYVSNAGELASVDTSSTSKLLGLFEPSHMNFDEDRSGDPEGDPALVDMTATAVEILSQNDAGYFLLVEGGRIDHAHHFVNAHRAMTDMDAFTQAVQWAVDNTDPANTLIIVTADHSHTFSLAGYPQRGNPILGKVKTVELDGSPIEENSLGRDGLPYTTVGYANGLGFAENAGGIRRLYSPHAAGRHDLTNVDTEDPGFHQETLVPLLLETHAGEDVAVHASGPSAQLFNGVIEQNAIFHVISEALSLGVSGYREGE
jgi:alkaline phosphatase